MKVAVEESSASTAEARFLIRPMTLEDIPQVQAIERDSFPTVWPETAYARELKRNRMARYLVLVDREASPPGGARQRQGPLGLLRRALGAARPAGSQDAIVGFVGIWLMVDEAHIVTIAVEPGHRRQRLGELLLIATVDLVTRLHSRVITLECRVSNLTAQALYEKYSFYKVGRRPKYYSDNHEDALIMTTEDIMGETWRRRFSELRRLVLSELGPVRMELPA